MVDGYIGFTGGINLADEYINKVKGLDTGRTPECGLRERQSEPYGNVSGNVELYQPFHGRLQQIPAVCLQEKEFTSDGFVQPYGDSPLDNENVGENIYLNIINRAKNYVYILHHI